MMKKEKKKENYRTIPLVKVKKMLGFVGRGFRSVHQWCKKQKILVIGEGRQKRILESDWIRTQLEYLKKAAIHTSPVIRRRLIERGVLDPPPRNENYEPKSDSAKNFMKGD